MRIRKVRLCKTKYNVYTIYSDIQNGDVLFDGVKVGNIDNGSFIYKLNQKEDTGTHTVKIENGTLAYKEREFYFRSSKTHTIDAVGGQYEFNKKNISSFREEFIPKYPSKTTINANTNVRLDTFYDIMGRDMYFYPTYYDVPKNDTLTAKDHNVELTQVESNNKLTVTIQQAANANVAYTVNSDIEGAEVQFSINNSDFTPVGNITGGTLNFNILKTDTASTVYIKLVGGTLPETKETYIFEAEDIDISAEAWSGKPTITSSKGMTTYSMPAVKTLNNNVTTTTINAVSNQQDGVAVGYTPNNNIIIAENKTTSIKQYTYSYVQNESGKTLRVIIRQDPGVQYRYTVKYNVPNSTVLADGENVGTISNGSCTFVKWNSGAKDSYAISFTGGQMPTPPDTIYAFSVNPTSLSFGDKGETKSVTITSTKTIYTNSHSAGVVSKGQTITLQYNTTNQVSNPTYSRSNSGTGLSGSGTSITFAANPNKQQRTGTVTYTQNGSNKTATVNCTQAAKVAYTYTVNSNCNGGTVYFNNVNKGTISSGQLRFEDDASSGTVRISGGVPSTSTSRNSLSDDVEYGIDYDYTTQYDCSVSKTSFSFGYDGGRDTATINNSSREGTRSRSTTRSRSRTNVVTTTYSAPSNRSMNGDSSITMNYTSSTSESIEYGSWSDYSYGSYGSWSYGSWNYTTPTITAQSSWAPGSISGNSEPWTLNVNCSSNSSTSSRSDYFQVVLLDGNYRINLSQSGKPAPEYVFRFEGSLGTHSANATTSRNDLTECGGSCKLISYKKEGNTYTRMSVNFASGGKPSQVYDYWAYGGNSGGTSPYYDFAVSCNKSNTVQTNSGQHSYTITMQQAESGKTASITIKQSVFVFNTTKGANPSDTVEWNHVTNTGYNYITAQSGGNSSNWGTWSLTSDSSQLATGGGGAGQTGKNGDIATVRPVTKNESFSDRKLKAYFNYGGKRCSEWTVTQKAAPNVFYINSSGYPSGYDYAISRTNVTSLVGSTTVPQIPISNNVNVTGVLTTNNSNTVAAPFTSYGSQSFKVWRSTTGSGSSRSWSVYKTITVSPGNTTS